MPSVYRSLEDLSDMPTLSPDQPLRWFARWVLVVLGLTLVALALVAVATYASDILLVGFLGLLFGVLLTKLTTHLTGMAPVGYTTSLSLVVILLLLAVAGGSYFLGSTLVEQTRRVYRTMDQSSQTIRRHVQKTPLLQSAVASIPGVDALMDSISEGERSGASKQGGSLGKSGAADRPANGSSGSPTPSENPDSPENQDSVPQGSSEGEAPSEDQAKSVGESSGAVTLSVPNRMLDSLRRFTSTTFGAVINIVLIFFLGLFLAVRPRSYREGTVRLFPPRMRGRADEVMGHLSDTLGSWLLGRFATMLITGVGTAISLWLVGLPGAFMIGLIAGIFTFIPNIGPLIAFIFALLMAIPQGMQMVWMVAGVFVAFQILESYVITPMIQQHQVSAPPALLLFTQAVFTVLFGLLGAMVAAPLLAILLTLHEHVYQREIMEARA